MTTVIALLLLAADLLAACLCWLSYGQGDYWAATFFFLLLIVGVCSEGALVIDESPDNVVDLETRRRQLQRAATTTDQYRAVRR